jgi:hypothetical protein
VTCHQVYFLQGKAPKEIHPILTETLACFLSGRAKDLPPPLYSFLLRLQEIFIPDAIQEIYVVILFTLVKGKPE